MTDAQLTTLGNHIRANSDPAVIAALAAGNNNEIATWYNETAVPNSYNYVSNVTAKEIEAGTGPDLRTVAALETETNPKIEAEAVKLAACLVLDILCIE